MDLVERTVNHTLTFYIEHIATSPGNISNTIIKLIVIGEVTYSELKVHVQQRMGITEDFELDYTPGHNYDELVAFQRSLSPIPCIWMYTVPLQEPGAAPWHLHNTRWSSLGPERQSLASIAYQLDSQQDPTSPHQEQPQPDPRTYSYRDLVWQAYPGVSDPRTRETLQEIADNASRPQVFNMWSYLRIAVIVTLIILYINWIMATFVKMLNVPTFWQMSVPACVGILGYASAKKIPYSPIVIEKRIRPKPYR